MPNHKYILYGSVAIASIIAITAAFKWTSSRTTAIFGFWEMLIITLCSLLYLSRGAALLFATLHNKPSLNQPGSAPSRNPVHAEVDSPEGSPALVSTQPTEPQISPSISPTTPSSIDLPAESDITATTERSAQSSPPPSLPETSDRASTPPSSFIQPTSPNGAAKPHKRPGKFQKAPGRGKPSVPAWLTSKVAEDGAGKS